LLQHYSITRQQRQSVNGQRSFVVWLTGLSGAGKSTIADHLQQYLFSKGVSVYVLDGDNIRHGINRDLGFSRQDRQENIRRVAEVAKLFCDAGIVTITAFISPYREDRKMARDIIGADSFVEVFVDADLETCRRRDVKGLYAKAKDGGIQNFTGISDPYESPATPDITIHSAQSSVEQSVDMLISWLHANQYL
jgi:adenylylsulfate kinase